MMITIVKMKIVNILRVFFYSIFDGDGDSKDDNATEDDTNNDNTENNVK